MDAVSGSVVEPLRFGGRFWGVVRPKSAPKRDGSHLSTASEPGAGLLVGLAPHASASGQPWALAMYGAAIVATVVLVQTDLDGRLQTYLQHNDVLPSTLSWAVLVVGNFWHFGLALGLYFWGRRRNPWLAGAGVATFQALAWVFLITTFFKVITGRQPPVHYFDGLPISTPWDTTTDAAAFGFDFWNHEASSGRFMWPSGHTAGAIAFVSSIVAYARERRWIAWVGYPVVILTGLAMVDGDFHWLSDVVAGALFGHAMAWSIGTQVRANPRYEARTLK